MKNKKVPIGTKGALVIYLQFPLTFKHFTPKVHRTGLHSWGAASMREAPEFFSPVKSCRSSVRRSSLNLCNRFALKNVLGHPEPM